jgi:DNA polymerase beta
MNETLIISFKALIQQEKQQPKPNAFRIRTYSKVVKILGELDFKVTDSKQLDGIHGVGEKTKAKIDELLTSGKLKKLEGFKMPAPENKTAVSEQKLLEGITGIGPVKANKLVGDGYTLEKLRTSFSENQDSLDDILTHHQILGVKYYEDLENRIPYSEITKIEEYIQSRLDWVNKTYFSPNEYQMVICGSYRRMKPDSGDIDVLFFNAKEEGDHPEFLTKFLARLTVLGFLRDHLTDPQTVTTKYMGFSKLPRTKYCRRIDMRCVNVESIGPALLYFTGSGEFNKNMRTFALKKKYTINEYGVYKLKADKSKGAQMPVHTEEDIFELLGMPYIEPNDRLATVKFK